MVQLLDLRIGVVLHLVNRVVTMLIVNVVLRAGLV